MPQPADSRRRSPARPGKIIAVHLSYASRADQRGRRPAAPVVLLQAVELGRGIRRHDRAPRRHRAARVRGRDRARHRHRRAARLARRRVEPRRVGHRRERLRPVRPARERQGLERPLEGRRRLHADRPGAASTRATVDPAALRAAHLGERRARAGRHDRRPASSRSPSSSPTSRSTSRSSRAT